MPRTFRVFVRIDAIAPVPCGTTARTNSGIVTIVLSTWKWPRRSDLREKSAVEIDEVFGLVIPEPDYATIVNRKTRLVGSRRCATLTSCSFLKKKRRWPVFSRATPACAECSHLLS